MAIFPQVKYLNAVFKGLLLLLLTGILYFELTRKGNLSEIWAVFKQQLAWSKAGWLILALALMPFNWLAETHKWHQFISRYEPMSRWKALQAVLAGVTVSLFTPNRVGEYGGRVLFVRPENRWKAVMVNLVGNFAQLMVLMTAGAAGIAWSMGRFWLFEPLYIQMFVLLATIGLGILFLVYFNINAVIPLARKIPVLHRIKRFVKDLRVLEQFSRRELAYILKWSTIRYCIFAAQYFFLLKFFDLRITLVDGYANISVLFLLQASLPLPPITGLVARGGLAVQMWRYASPNEVSSLAATFTLWIINLILPALVGTFSILYVNIAKTIVYENDRH